ncbi:MAG TPA: ring-cleaving dioxygenase [Chloroflexota bacterium]
MNRQIPGIHHVTAIASNPQQNIDFYTGFLGLRLVKLTVNFDDPESYHLYYGDSVGSPGTALTFFAWPGAPRGRTGAGQVVTTSLSIPPDSVDFWLERFSEHDVAFRGPDDRIEEKVISFLDPDGLKLELVAHADPHTVEPWQDSPVPARYATRGFRGVTISETSPGATELLLAETMGLHRSEERDGRVRYETPGEVPGRIVDVLSEPGWPPGRVAVGTVHHVAWRAGDDQEQLDWRDEIAGLGIAVTPVIDRRYFHSIYFREPGGVLFEIATDPPGFAVDEPVDALGTSLKLPPWLEASRPQIERRLPPLTALRRVA